MSAIAKKMMEKYGWKEGEGLGKSREGMKTYVKVARRDAHAAIGLGHTADPVHSCNKESTHAVELDTLYGQITTSSERRKRCRAKAAVSEMHECKGGEESSTSFSPIKRGGRHSDGSTCDDDEHSSNNNNAHTPSMTVSEKGIDACYMSDHISSNSSTSESSGSDDDGDENTNCDVTRMSDAELLKRCGGVRLGRAGRHRVFNGKLTRIEISHQNHATAT